MFPLPRSLVLSALAACVSIAAARGAAPTLQAHPFPLSSVRLGEGPLKERQDVDARFLMEVDADRLLAPFREVAGLPLKGQRYGGWEAMEIGGHSLGHYLSAISELYAATGNEALRQRADYIVGELARCQAANGDGYLLSVRKSLFDELAKGDIRAKPFNLNGLWVPFYTEHKVLAGLRDAYRMTGNQQALDVERRAVDGIIRTLEPLNPDQIQQVLICEHGGMNEVLADLAEDTGDSHYLEAAIRDFTHQAALGPLMQGQDKLDGWHVNAQVPKVIGLAQEYEQDGNPAYRTAAETFWKAVADDRSYVVGCPGEGEHFFPVGQFPDKLTPHTCETCNSYNMLQLTKHLFQWQPEARLMDFEERALLNDIAAQIGRKPGEFGYFLPLKSVALKVWSTPFSSWWCCVGTGMENPALYGQQVFFQGTGRDANTVYINHFFAATLTWDDKDVVLHQQSDFPDSGTVRLVVNCAEPTQFALKIRKPGWCDKPVVKVNGKPVRPRVGNDGYMVLDRKWRDGETVELALDMKLHVEPLPHSEGKIVALMYGPTVLAGVVPGKAREADERFTDHLKAKGITDAPVPVIVTSKPDKIARTFRQVDGPTPYFVSEDSVKPQDLRFIPLYQVYEQQYAVYFHVLTPAEWKAQQKQQAMVADAK